MILFLRLIKISLLCAGMLGCGIAPSHRLTELHLPEHWKNRGAFPVASLSQDLSGWWARFDDPTLSQIISVALKNSPNLAAAGFRITEAQAARQKDRASFFPDLDSSASVTSRASSNDKGASNSETLYTAGFSSSWEIDWLGKNQKRVEAASALVRASEENFHSVQAALAAEIATNYTELRTREHLLEVLRSIVRTREETWELAQWRQKSGQTDALETNRVRSSLERAKSTIPALEQTLSESRQRLCLLAGLAPGGLDKILIEGNQLIPSPPGSLALSIPADTLRQRPDVRLAGYQLLAAAANQAEAKAERFPSLNLRGSLGLNALSASKIFDPQTLTRDLIGSVGAPIFDAGKIRAEIERQSAIEQQAAENYRAKVLLALSEVEDALITCQKTSERLLYIQKATESAREASRLASQSYQAGIRDITSVLDAQRELLELESDLSRFRADRTIAYIRLYTALGGGWKTTS